jgi:hypothetical protein
MIQRFFVKDSASPSIDFICGALKIGMGGANRFCTLLRLLKSVRNVSRVLTHTTPGVKNEDENPAGFVL